MPISTTDITLFIWVTVGLIGGIAMIISLRAGWKDGADKSRGIKWRKIKLLSIIIGLIGLVMALISFEKTLREFNADSSRYAFELYVELKMLTTYNKAVACSKDMSSEEFRSVCFDYSNIDGQIAFSASNPAITPHIINNLMKDQRLDNFLSIVNNKLELIQYLIKSASEKPIIDISRHPELGVLIYILLSLSFAGSLGEAAFQLRQEIVKSPATSLGEESGSAGGLAPKPSANAPQTVTALSTEQPPPNAISLER